MKNICLYFHVHQPIQLKTYRFFEIGDNHLYFDDEYNRALIRRIADSTYIPTNRILLDMIKKYDGKFRISFSISGTLIHLLEKYAMDVIHSFRELADTGCVEFLSGTNDYSLASLADKEEFSEQVKLYEQKILTLFGMKPKVFVNTELIYSDSLGEMISEMGYSTVLAEGTDQSLKWRSPNYLYHHPAKPQLRILMNNFKLSEDIKADISENIWSRSPINPENFLLRLKSAPVEEKVFNVMVDYENFIRQYDDNSCMIEFMIGLLQRIFSEPGFRFCTPSDLTANISPCGEIDVPDLVSWSAKNENFNTSDWNVLQIDSFNKLYSLKDSINRCKDADIMESWHWLQSSDHFFYMSSIWFENNSLSEYSNQYDSPYLAYINYMNILNDFSVRLNNYYPEKRQQENKLNKKLAGEKLSSAAYDSMLEKKYLAVHRTKILHKEKNSI